VAMKGEFPTASGRLFPVSTEAQLMEHRPKFALNNGI